MVTVTKLAREVKLLRQLQKKYFATKSPYLLTHAKHQEQRVDKLIDEIALPNEPKQEKIF